MSQAQRNVGFTPFSRHEFYDNTYLQRLRNDIKRLDNTNSVAISSPHPALQAGDSKAASKYQVEQSHTPRPIGSGRSQKGVMPPENNREYNGALLHPNHYSRNRSLSRNNRSPSRAGSSITPHRSPHRSVTPRIHPYDSKSTNGELSRSRSPRVLPSSLGNSLNNSMGNSLRR